LTILCNLLGLINEQDQQQNERPLDEPQRQALNQVAALVGKDRHWDEQRLKTPLPLRASWPNRWRQPH